MKNSLLLAILGLGTLCISAGYDLSAPDVEEVVTVSTPPPAVPTYYEDISPIIYNRCTQCHRTGEIGPMPLTNITEVTTYGAMIKFVTEIKYMPPWKADPDYSHFLDENYLTDTEIQLIGDWYDNGMQPGNPANEAAMPSFPTGSALGTPDLVLSMEQAFEQQGTNMDQYQVFVLDPQLTQTKEVRAVEFRPGNPNIAHHALIAMDTTNQADILDQNDPNNGYEMFGGFGFDPTEFVYNVWTPGQSARFFPPDMSKQLFPNSKLLLQMHYAPTPVNEFDSSTVNLFFASTPAPRYVQTAMITPYDLSVPFALPPNQISTFTAEYTVPATITLLSVMPHQHLLGKTWESYIVDPQGDTTKLIRINDWHFNYQYSYAFENLIKVTVGSTLYVTASYDNTTANPLNPNNPPQWTYWGDNTSDEMFLGFFDFVMYQTGDENIDLNANELQLEQPGTKTYPVYPNPAAGTVTFGFSLNEGSKLSIKLFDAQGKVVKTLERQMYFPKGQQYIQFDASSLTQGTYFIGFEHGGTVFTEPFVVNE